MSLPTQIELNEEYQNLAKYEANELNIDIDISNLTDYNIKGKVLSGVCAGLAQDCTTLFNNVYPQYANSQGINLILSNAGVPVTFPSSPAILELTVNNLIANKIYNIPIGAILTAPNGATYSVIGNNINNIKYIIITSINNTFNAISTNLGQNTTQNVGIKLTFTPPIISTDNLSSFSDAIVLNQTDGANQESLTDSTNRAIEIKQTPLCGTRSTDFKYIILNAAKNNNTNSITNALVLINNQLTYTNKYNLAVFIMSGTPIDNNILNHGLLDNNPVVFNRTNTIDLPFAQNILNQQDIIGIPYPVASTVETQQITNLTSNIAFFNIVVTLQNSYTLSTSITQPDGIFTVTQLIQREVRRAICNQPLGATLEYNYNTDDPNIFGSITHSTLPISAIEQQLDSALGTSNTAGTLGSFLLNRTVYTYSGSSYVYQVNIPLSVALPIGINDKLGWVYDISTTANNIYSNILVSLTL